MRLVSAFFSHFSQVIMGSGKHSKIHPAGICSMPEHFQGALQHKTNMQWEKVLLIQFLCKQTKNVLGFFCSTTLPYKNIFNNIVHFKHISLHPTVLRLNFKQQAYSRQSEIFPVFFNTLSDSTKLTPLHMSLYLCLWIITITIPLAPSPVYAGNFGI